MECLQVWLVPLTALHILLRVLDDWIQCVGSCHLLWGDKRPLEKEWWRDMCTEILTFDVDNATKNYEKIIGVRSGL